MREKYFSILLLFIGLLTVPLLGFAAHTQSETVQDTTPTTTEEVIVSTDEHVTLHLFHSLSCPHCRKERAFLETIQDKYPDLTILQYEVEDSANIDLMRTLAKQYDAERALGSVPLTFVGDEYFVGYDSDKTSGKEIERAIRVALGLSVDDIEEQEGFIDIPVVGSINVSEYSLPALAVLLGFLDGFNVCSLGALVLIIGLTLKLQRRRAIVLFGGTFIVTTAVVYGALIVAWYHIFELFSSYIGFMKVGVSLLALAGGLYFLKEFLRMRREGAVCELQESRLICKLMERTGRAFEDNTKLLGILGTVLLFAAVIAVVEFPCSAAVPLVFAGMLAEAGMSTVAYLSHIGLFVFFYMLDELIIFGIAAYKLKLWMTDGKFTKWAVFAEAFILLAIGLWYLVTTLGLIA